MRWLRRPEPSWLKTLHETMTEQEIKTLATFNSEVGRGIVHTPEWVEKMAKLQRRYNEAMLS